MLFRSIPGFFKNYDAETDEKISAVMLKLFRDSTDSKFIPSIYSDISSKYADHFDRYVRDVFKKSIFTDQARLTKFLLTLSHHSLKKFRKDPAIILYASFSKVMNTLVREDLARYNNRIASLQARYMKAQMEMTLDPLYPDANLTLRCAYGQVSGYRPSEIGRAHV